MKLFLIDPNPVALMELDFHFDQAGLAVAGAASDCVAASHGIAACGAEIVVADPYNSQLASRKGSAALADLSARFPKVTFIVFSLNPADVFAERALRAGAKAYVTKTRPEQLLAIVKAIIDGVPIPETIVPPVERTDIDPLLVLAPRQLETLVLTGFGYKTRDVAALFRRSVKTIETHKGSIKDRLKIPHHVALATYAARWLHENPLLAHGIEHPPSRAEH